MKTKLITTLLLFAGITFAQNEVEYTYDNAGNRIKRENNTTFLAPSIQPAAQALEELAESGVELNAHPNPTSSATSVFVIIDPETISEDNKANLASGITMQLIDVTGKVLKTKKGNTMQQSFNLQGMSSGVYFVKVFTENGKLVGERKILRE